MLSTKVMAERLFGMLMKNGRSTSITGPPLEASSLEIAWHTPNLTWKQKLLSFLN